MWRGYHHMNGGGEGSPPMLQPWREGVPLCIVVFSREVKPNLLIRHKGSQRIFISLNNRIVNSAAPGNNLAHNNLSVATIF